MANPPSVICSLVICPNACIISWMVSMAEKRNTVNQKLTPTSKPGTTFTNGILNEERKSLCKSIYANEVVKLTIQITDPSVMVIEKDVSATFTDMLGIVGKL